MLRSLRINIWAPEKRNRSWPIKIDGRSRTYDSRWRGWLETIRLTLSLFQFVIRRDRIAKTRGLYEIVRSPASYGLAARIHHTNAITGVESSISASFGHEWRTTTAAVMKNEWSGRGDHYHFYRATSRRTLFTPIQRPSRCLMKNK
jgi:hypothetical protein